jgi:hypothetical protein
LLPELTQLWACHWFLSSMSLFLAKALNCFAKSVSVICSLEMHLFVATRQLSWFKLRPLTNYHQVTNFFLPQFVLPHFFLPGAHPTLLRSQFLLLHVSTFYPNENTLTSQRVYPHDFPPFYLWLSIVMVLTKLNLRQIPMTCETTRSLMGKFHKYQ